MHLKKLLIRSTIGRRLTVAALTVCMAVTGAVVVSAAPAQAVPGLDDVTVSSASDSVSPKTVTVNCPAGKRLYGIPASISGGFGNVTLDDVIPNAALTSATVTAYENGAYASSWRLRGRAICGNPVANLQRVFKNSSVNSNSAHFATASCPAGTKAYGVGGQITGGVGNVFFGDIYPTLGTTSSSSGGGIVSAYEHGDYAGNWQVTAYAICGSPASTMVQVAEPAASSSDSPKQVTAICPAGTQVHGIGNVAFFGFAGFGNIVINSIDTVGGTLNFGEVIAYENGNIPDNWLMTAVAICAS
jgi:hypothetical protein